MKIGVAGSMQFTERLIEVRDQLNDLGHEAFISEKFEEFIGKSDEEKEDIKLRQKNEEDIMREFWNQMQGADALLILNLDKNGIENYIGGNAFMEMSWAYVLNQKIYLYNSIPEIPYYKTEIEGMKPVILRGDLNQIK